MKKYAVDGLDGYPNELAHKLDDALELNAELLDALQFYADESNYTGWTDPDYQWTGESKDYPSSIEGDMGEIARQAIAKVEKE